MKRLAVALLMGVLTLSTINPVFAEDLISEEIESGEEYIYEPSEMFDPMEDAEMDIINAGLSADSIQPDSSDTKSSFEELIDETTELPAVEDIYSGEELPAVELSWSENVQIPTPKAQSTTSGVMLTWTKVQGADGYIIGAIQNGKTYRQIDYVAGESKTTYTDKNASLTDYSYYWIFAYKKINGKVVRGKASTSYAYGIKLLPAPTGVSASATVGSVTLQWKPVNSADGYLVKCKRGNKNAVIIGETSGTSFSDVNAPTNQISFYWIFAYKYNRINKRPGEASNYVYAQALNAPVYNDTPNADSVLALAKIYDPDGYYILSDSIKRGRKGDIDFWCKGGANSAAASDVCVHEEFHGFVFENNDYDWNTGQFILSYYMGDGKIIQVPESPSFPTEQWASTLPANLRTFRYDTYVAAGGKNDSNTKGANGILNEFCAYYWGLHNQVQLYPFYEMNDGFYYVYSAVTNGIQAFTEFRFYMLGYLDYAKKNRNDIYQGFLSNQAFVNIYCIMERKYEHLINQAQNLTNNAWNVEAVTLYNEVKKDQYMNIEKELFSHATVAVLPSVKLR